MMISSKMAKIEIYSLRVENKDQTFGFSIDVSKVDRKELNKVPNPCFKKMMRKLSHLKGVYIDDRSEKDAPPIHLIIGASEYAKVKTPTRQRSGKPWEPVAELTRFG